MTYIKKIPEMRSRLKTEKLAKNQIQSNLKKYFENQKKLQGNNNVQLWLKPILGSLV